MSKEGNLFEKTQRGQFVRSLWLYTRSYELYNCGVSDISISMYLISNRYYYGNIGYCVARI